jgi:anti-sigma-K factor RskA
MMDGHIIDVLEQTPLPMLSESNVALIRTHARTCQPCREAYEAALLSTLLLKNRAAETVAPPPPFFQTRVLAALRERQAGNSLWRMWKSAGALVSAMAVTVAALATLTFVAPAETGADLQQLATNGYSAEELILDQEDSQQEQMSYEQVLSTIYSADDNNEAQ